MKEENLKKLFQKYLDNTCTQEEKKYLDELFESYIDDTDYGESNSMDDEQALQSKLFEKVKDTIKTSEKHQQTNFKKKSNTPIWAIAASVAILLGLGMFWFSYRKDKTVDTAIPNMVTISRTTLAGEKKEVHLSDGSVVYLNSESTLSYDADFGKGDTRSVKLVGEAFFEVAPDKSKPFIIESGSIITEVKGTSFNVMAFPENKDIAITVLTGVVDVSKSGESSKIQLEPNKQALFNKEAGQINVLAVDALQSINWKNGILHFEEAQLEDVLKTLERWYGVDIITEDLTLNKCTLTSTFDRSSLYEVLESIKFAKEGISYSIDDENNTIELKGNCNE